MARVSGIAGALALGLFVAAETGAQNPPVQPTQGQSAEQVAKDQSECQASAKQSSGFDPAAPAPPDSGKERHAGGRVKGAAAGAAAGAVAAEVRGRDHEAYDQIGDEAKQQHRQNEAKDAATVGAAVGAAKQRQDRRSDRREDRSAEKQQEEKKAAYDQAYKSCLSARGYTTP